MELPDREICYLALQSREPRFDGRAETWPPWRAYAVQHLRAADTVSLSTARSAYG
jgi:hypothetical protein